MRLNLTSIENRMDDLMSDLISWILTDPGGTRRK